MFEHHWYVKEVLKCLCKTDLYIRAEKYEFHSKSVKYLEYILFLSDLTMSEQSQDYSKLARV